MMALYSPIHYPGGGLLVKPQGAPGFQILSLQAGTYETLADLVAAFGLSIAPAGYEVSLEHTAGLAGLSVVLSHSVPFVLEIAPASKLGPVLGFPPGTYQPVRTRFESVSPPPGSLGVEAPGLPLDERPWTARVQSSTLTGEGESACWGRVTTRHLKLVGLDGPRIQALRDLWHRSASEGERLYLDTGEGVNAESPHLSMIAVRPDWSLQSRLAPSRTWPAPHPLRATVELALLEET